MVFVHLAIQDAELSLVHHAVVARGRGIPWSLAPMPLRQLSLHSQWQPSIGGRNVHAQALTNLSRSGIRFGDFTWGPSRIYQTNIEVQNGPPLAFVDPCGPIGHRSGFPARLFGRFLFRLDFVLFLASAFLVPCCCRFGYSCRFAAAETKAKTT